MLRLVALLSVAVVCLSTLGAASRCDRRIIRTIQQKYWNNGYCVPRDLFRTALFLSPEVVKIVTPNYYPEQEKMVCLYSKLEDDIFNLFVQYENSSTATQSPAISFDLIEEYGAQVDPVNQIYRYHLYVNKLGVTAFYRCSMTGKIGAPEGLIKVSSRGYDQDALAQSVQDLVGLGIDVSGEMFQECCV